MKKTDIDTIVNPIIISGIWNFLAIPLAPSTKKSAPFINTIIMAKKGEAFDGIDEENRSEEENEKTRKTIINIIYVILGIVALSWNSVSYIT